jgi:hypothetical protein
MEGGTSLAIELGLEKQLGASHAELGGNSYYLIVWERVILVKLTAVVCSSLLLLVVLGNVAKPLLDVAHKCELGGSIEGKAHLI